MNNTETRGWGSSQDEMIISVQPQQELDAQRKHFAHTDTLNLIKLVRVWSRDGCKELEMP